ncbi:MAG: hypothetical protein QF607_03005 [Nitrospinaceae bacterium]|nr:hypothetical protein [Nitrospinaceae bacterium]
MRTHSEEDQNAVHQTNHCDNRTRKLICVVLAVLILAVYWQVQGHEFINYDDSQYITENKHVTSEFSGENVLWVFTGSYASNWHPVS